MSLYMESSCFIDIAKYKLGMTDKISDLANKEPHIQACIKLLDAAEKGEVVILTANITNSECQHLDGLVTAEMRRLFRSILTSGKIVKLVTDTVFISERAQELRWVHDIALSGADAHHLATALESGCEEFITYDNGFLKKKDKIHALGIRPIKGHESQFLPVEPPPEVPAPIVDADTMLGQGKLFNAEDERVAEEEEEQDTDE
jgi:predicted nucleic acid-binding protein